MPDIAPFKGYHFNVKDRIELEQLVCPPHDVISDAERSALLKKNRNNIVKVILPDSYPEAAQILNKYVNNGRITHRDFPAFYIYETKYIYNGLEQKRYGLVALVKLSVFQKKEIIPHERTFEKVSEDRLNLFRETKANFKPIFFIFNGNPIYTKILNETITQASFLSLEDSDGVKHTIWVIDNPQTISQLQESFKSIPLIIADGHHRYISALTHSYENGTKYVMGLLVDINDPGLNVFPTHRLIRYIFKMTTPKIIEKIEKYFNIEKYTFDESQIVERINEIITRLEKKDCHAFGLLLYGEPTFFIINLKEEYSPTSLIEEEFSYDWKRLDVSILHYFVFKLLLEIPQYINDSENIIYIKNLEEAVESVQKGLYQALFILNPTKVEQILKITKGSEIMPHKSTYFYPKPLSGLIIYKWDSKESE